MEIIGSPDKLFEEHKGIIFCKLWVEDMSCVSMFNEYVRQRLLLVGETQHTAKFGTQQACALPTSSREKKRSLHSRRLEATQPVSFSLALGRSSFWDTPIWLSVRGPLGNCYFLPLFILFFMLVFFYFFLIRTSKKAISSCVQITLFINWLAHIT